MIGVLLKPDELEIAEEFFQLFKTPWEPFREGRAYEVVVSTNGRMPGCAPRFLAMYGSEPGEGDQQTGTQPSERLENTLMDYYGKQLPVYGRALSFAQSLSCTSVLTANTSTIALSTELRGTVVLRVGYDLFREISVLLSTGQTSDRSRIPALELHIGVLRDAILAAGLPLLEVPPIPAGHPFLACLTHDIDFVGIRNHRFDHTMWGFLYRSTLGGLRSWLTGKLSLGRLVRMWRAALSLPFVYLGLARDFWSPFEWYLRIEKDLPATYFLIPFRDKPGNKLDVPNPARRAARYDVTDIPEWTKTLVDEGYEIGIHGIDSWHSVAAARTEMRRIAEAVGQPATGIRMHWLLQDKDTYRVLDEAGFAYDSSAGYNDTIGYRCGTTQVFRPAGALRLLELPLHIQDGALFYPTQLGLSESEAWNECELMIERAIGLGGVLTVLWHDRSHAPERFWGDFYIRLLERLRASGAWFGNASQVVDWFRRRRQVRFVELQSEDGSVRVALTSDGPELMPPITVRAFQRVSTSGAMVAEQSVTDVPWRGTTHIEFDSHSGTLFHAA